MKLFSKTLKVLVLLTLITIITSTSSENTKCLEIFQRKDIPTKTKDFYIEVEDLSNHLMQNSISFDNFKEIIFSLALSSQPKAGMLKDYYLSEENFACKVTLNSRTEKKLARKRQLAANLNCNFSSYYSAMFKMNFPTGSNMTVNANSAVCNCLGNFVNSKTKENKIFCICPNGDLIKEGGLECISIKDCNSQNKVVIDNYCVSCVSGSTYNASTNKCVCTSGSWRPNYCNPTAQTAINTGFSFGAQAMCSKNDLVHTISYNSAVEPTIVKNILLSPELTIFLSSCNMTGVASASLKLNGTPVNYLTSFPNTGCNGTAQKKYLAFHPSESNVYTLEISCTTAPCNGDFILLTELINISGISVYPERIMYLDNSLNALQNTLNYGLSSSANYGGLLWNLKKGDEIAFFIRVHTSGSRTFVIRIGNLSNTQESVINITSTSASYYTIPQDDDYYVKIGCSISGSCTGWLQLIVQKTDHGASKYIETDFRPIISLTQNTNNATINTITIGCSATEPTDWDYLFKNLSRGDYIEVKAFNQLGLVLFTNSDLQLNLEVQPIEVSGRNVFRKSITVPGNYCLTFGCIENTTYCSGTADIKVRKTVTSYLDGFARSFGGSFTNTLQIGSGTGLPHDRLKNIRQEDIIYVETLPVSYLDYDKSTALTLTGGGATYSNIPALFGNYSKIYVYAVNDGNHVVNLTCNSGCTSKYLLSVYSFPSVSGIIGSECYKCPDQSISINNECKLCSSLVAPNGFIYSLAYREGIQSNDCSDYPANYLYFNKAGKYYECKSGFTPDLTTTPHSCKCLDTIINGECLITCLTADGTRRVVNSELIRNSAGNCECSDTNRCYDQLANYTCINPVAGKISNNDAKNCTNVCTDSAFCYDPLTFKCKNKTENSLVLFSSTVVGGECVEYNRCRVETLGTSLILYSYPNLISNANGNCQCTNTNLCLDTSNFSCINGSSGKINNKDGKDCSTACTNSTKCFDPNNFTCRDKIVSGSELFVSSTTGGACIYNNCVVEFVGTLLLLNSNPSLIRDASGYCRCSNTDLCLNSSNNTCITGSSGKVNNTNGKNCSFVCSDTAKCFDSNFICKNKIENGIEIYKSENFGGSCIFNTCTVQTTSAVLVLSSNTSLIRDASGVCQCSNTDLCFDSSNNTCVSGSLGKINNKDGKVCTASCTDSTKCFDSNYNCVNKFENDVEIFTTTTTGGACLQNSCIVENTGAVLILSSNTFLVKDTEGYCQCSNTDLCLNSSNNTCISGLSDKINNKDGKVCTASCTDSTKCFDSNYTCINKFENGAEILTSTTTGGACLLNTCTVQTTNTVLVLSSNTSLIRNASGVCQCSNTDLCLNSSNNTCITGLSDKINNKDGKVCTTSCTDPTKCFNLNFMCVNKFENGVELLTSTTTGGACLPTTCLVSSTGTVLNLSNNPSLIRDVDGYCQCSNTDLCLNSSNNTCITGLSDKINNKNGKVCTATCTDSTKCYDSNYSCISKIENSIQIFTSATTGGACDFNTCTVQTTEANLVLSNNPTLIRDASGNCRCSNTDLCLNSSNNTCISGLSDKINNKDGKVCTASCTVSTKCFDSNYTCINKFENGTEILTSTTTGGACVFNTCTVQTTSAVLILSSNTSLIRDASGNCQCSNTNLCLNSSNNTCVIGSLGKINNKDGKNCTASCTDSTKCFDSNYNCVNKFENDVEIFTTTTTGGACLPNTCLVSSTEAILVLSSNPTLIRNASGNCRCSNTDLCLNSSNNTCISGLSDKINNKDGKVCTAFCTDSTKCFDSNYTCINKFENGSEILTSSTTGGACSPNTCLVSSTGATLVLSTSQSLSRESNGTCICSDTNKCIDTDSNICINGSIGKVNNKNGKHCTNLCIDSSKCFDPATFVCNSMIQNGLTVYTSTVNGGVCISDICLLPTATISELPNKLSVIMSIPQGTTNLKVEFTDPNGVLSQVNFNRYYMQILFTDSIGEKITKNSLTIEGVKSSTNSASIIISESLINEFCSLEVPEEPSKGRVCYFLALIADKCNTTLDLIVYTHFAARIVNGNYAINDFSVARQELEIDYCRWLPVCFISVNYDFTLKYCQNQDNTCIPLNLDHKFRREDVVYIQIEVFDKLNQQVIGRTITLNSVRTKLFDNNGQEIDTPERQVSILGQPVLFENKIIFMFQITAEILFYDLSVLLSSNIRLLVIVEIEGERMLRYLEIASNRKEVVPQSGGLITLNFDSNDLLEYLSVSEDDNKDNTKVIVATLCSLIGVLLLVVTLFLLHKCVKKNNKKVKTSEFIVTTDMKSQASAPENMQFKKINTEFNTDRQYCSSQV